MYCKFEQRLYISLQQTQYDGALFPSELDVGRNLVLSPKSIKIFMIVTEEMMRLWVSRTHTKMQSHVHGDEEDFDTSQFKNQNRFFFDIVLFVDISFSPIHIHLKHYLSTKAMSISPVVTSSKLDRPLKFNLSRHFSEITIQLLKNPKSYLFESS